MSSLPGTSNTNSSSSSDRTQVNTMISSEQKQSSTSQVADPETASLASYTSTTALLKDKSKKDTKGPAVDAKKLQEQALKSQKPIAWMPPAAFRF